MTRALIEQLVCALEFVDYLCPAWSTEEVLVRSAITAAREYLAAPEQSELQDAKDTIELLEMRIDQLEAPEPVNQMLLAALQRIADPRNVHFAGDAQVVASAAVAQAEQAPQMEKTK